MFGMAVMIVSVVFLGLEGASKNFQVEKTQDMSDIGTLKGISQKDMTYYAIVAIIWGLICPIFYTIKAYAIRVYCDNYEAWDLGIDGQIFENLCYCLMYLVYIYYEGFVFSEFIYG